MTVYETEVPGVGRKFEMETGGGESLVVVIHHDGKREVYRRPEEDADGERLFSLTDKQARQFGTILEGAYFQPVETHDVQVPVGEASIEWVDVTGGSPLVGNTLQSAKLRQRTGVSVIAIQRGEETIPNPKPEVTIEEGDILVVIGARDEQAALSEFVSPDRGDTDAGEPNA